jgi:hypothetical protein
MPTDFRGIPGVYTGQSLTSRNIFTGAQPHPGLLAPTLGIIDGTYSRDTGNSPVSLLRAGLLMGKVTSGGKYRNSIIGLTTASYTSGGTSLTVAAAVATECARLIVLAGGNISLNVIGPPTAAGTVAITAATCSAASGTTLTVTSLGVNKASGCIIAPADGSHLPLTILPSPFGVDVNDISGNSLDQPVGQYLRSADLIATQIINLTEGDASVQAWIKAQLKAVGVFTFDNDR